MEVKNKNYNTKKEIPFLKEIEPKEVKLYPLKELKESKYIVLTVERYTKIIETKNYAMGKLFVLEKQIEEMERKQYINGLKEFPIRKKQIIIKKLENEINRLNQDKLLEVINKEETSEYIKAKRIGEIEGIKLAINRIKETE